MHYNPFKFLATLALSLLTLYSCGDSKDFSEPLPDVVDFNFHVRPILVQNCYLCHGPDVTSRKAGLRLDTYEGATAALKEEGYAIIPGNASNSKLVYRINHSAPDQIMPPPESNYKLTEREKALLEKWINQGAEWKDHWAFIKPENKQRNFEAKTIDALIDHKLQQKGLQKVPEANKSSLIRRVSYLITGLPPTPNDVEKFITDNSPNAYNKMVDNYLESPAYGERWARHWMDLVRYAETKGHEFDYQITGAYKYRDYLIRAFNDDIPYNQLLKEHLAGDLIEQRINTKTGSLESQLGTAFFAMGEGKHSPVDIKEEEATYIDNLIDVTSKTFQGLTVSCAKCHDHKFDPISAADYYAFYGIMESSRLGPIADISKETKQTAKEINDLKRYMKKMIGNQWSDLPIKTVVENSEENTEPITDTNYKNIGDFRSVDFDGWLSKGLAFGDQTTLGNPIIDKYSNKIKALDNGRASSTTYGKGHFGILQSPNFILEKNFIGVKARGKNSSIRIIIDNFQMIQNPIYGELEHKINDQNWKNYVFDISPWKGHKAYIEILPGQFKGHNYNLSDEAFIESEYAIVYDSVWPSEIDHTKPILSQEKINFATLEVSPNSIKKLNSALKKGNLPSSFPEIKGVKDSSDNLTQKLKTNGFYYGFTEGEAVNSQIFNRGNHNDLLEDEIPRRFLSALPLGEIPFQSKGSGRLELAEAMLNKDNPLTARVMTNRIWHHLFGKGIVETVDNFGLQGKLPSNPELLDYLAVNFQINGWSIKNLIREIVISEAFKRSTIRTEELSKKDPNNNYLASFPVRRIEAEAIRDGILVVTENLDSTMFGPPVKTYLTEFMQGRGRPNESGPLDGAGRRSIYQEVRRNFLDPMMVTFDRPIPFSTFGKRNITNVPAQSLTLMNDPFISEQAASMAEKLLAQKELSFDKKIEWIYKRTFSRKPTAEEVQKAEQFISKLEKMQPNNENEKSKEIEIWKDFCHSIFNLKEFIYLI
ncbi:PSD1 and planctomycete cytochrome C domain-containing protein [Aurantibacter sp.]|uniref:PSD1 and planctomycete cytochrome C domain-containing protein n=1 Tax=Aurantibacter sp. TaxID=2807103 RepID=UPI0032637573